MGGLLANASTDWFSSANIFELSFRSEVHAAEKQWFCLSFRMDYHARRNGLTGNEATANAIRRNGPIISRG
jgi:hypothetical protein